jgi:error-prone DNA polymerase
VDVRPPCVNASDTDCSLEIEDSGGGYQPAGLDIAPEDWGKCGPAIRLGLRLIVGLGEDMADHIVAERRAGGPFTSIHDCVRRVERLGLGRRKTYVALSKLAAADAFACFAVPRREALWQTAALGAYVPNLFRDLDVTEKDVVLPPLTAMESTVADYHTKRLTLGDHPIALIRADLDDEGVIPTAELVEIDHGTEVSVAGLVINRQHPETAKGIIFMTLEDESAVANIVVHPQVFRDFRAVAVGSNRLIVSGTVEKNAGVIHVVARSFRSLMEDLDLTTHSRDFH